MNILIAAQQRGSVNALAPVARELISRGYEVDICATGNDNEAAGFDGLVYRHEEFIRAEDCSRLISGHDVVITGLSGYNSSDGYLLRAAVSKGIPVIGVQDQDKGYKERLGTNIEEFPLILAVMNKECESTIRKEIKGKAGEELVKRTRVVGWTAFDQYVQIRERFDVKDRINLLSKLGISQEDQIYVHFSQNVHPNSEYGSRSKRSFDEKWKDFLYEQGVLQATFEAASDLGLKLTVKPHPGEIYVWDYTKEMAKRHGFNFIPAKACDSKQLMLAASSVTAGRSTCLTEAALFDINTGGIIPDVGEEWISPFPPLALEAIPYTQTWDGIKDVLKLVVSKEEPVKKELSEKRKRFSVDGKASKRLADIVEEFA